MHQKLQAINDHLPIKSGVVYVVDDDDAVRDSLAL